MELGQRLKTCRLELGLSQRQLCGDTITRNMLSQIENGTARPSMDTLAYLADRLGKPVSFFLQEDAVTSPNQEIMVKARNAFLRKDYEAVRSALEEYKEPDETFDWERDLLWARANMALAREAFAEQRIPYAKTLLQEASVDSPYFNRAEDLEYVLLLAEIDPDAFETVDLPRLDSILLAKARKAITQGNMSRAGDYLRAADDHTSVSWNLLRAEVYFAAGEYEQATECYHRVEETQPELTWEKLEQCYIGMEDYKRAYEYACKQKK